MSDLVGNPEDRISHNEAQIVFEREKKQYLVMNVLQSKKEKDKKDKNKYFLFIEIQTFPPSIFVHFWNLILCCSQF